MLYINFAAHLSLNIFNKKVCYTKSAVMARDEFQNNKNVYTRFV